MVRIDINVGGTPKPHKGNVPQRKNARFLSSEMVLRYLIGNDEKVDTVILCKPYNLELFTTDFNVYEALGSIKSYDNIQFNKLTKLFEMVNVISYKHQRRQDKPILKDERVEQLRKIALQDNKKNNDEKKSSGGN